MKSALLISSMLVSGFCGIVAELSMFNLASTLLGGTNRTLLYTMGVMMFAMGVGSLFTEQRVFRKISFDHFALNEVLLSLMCALSLPAVYFVAGFFPEHIVLVILICSFLIGCLIGMEIPIILRLNSELGLALPANSARVLMADYFGSLAGFAGFPIIMLPLFGLYGSALSGAAINLLIAAVTLVVFRSHLRWPRICSVLVMSQMGLMLVAGLNLAKLRSVAEHHLFRDPVRFEHSTPYQNLVITSAQESRPIKPGRMGRIVWQNHSQRGLIQLAEDIRSKSDVRLFINGGLQFSTIDEARYHETLTHPVMYLTPEATQALVLGGGDGLAVRELLKSETLQEILLVDLDLELIQLFRHDPLAQLNDYSLLHPKVKAIAADAFWFLRTQAVRPHLMIIDFPDPTSLDTARLYSKEFFQMAYAALHEHGCLAIQSSSPLFQKGVFLSIRKTLMSAGFDPVSLHINMKSFEEWGFHVACKSMSESKVKKRLSEFPEPYQSVWLNHDAVKASMLFGKGILEDLDQAPINELENLRILNLSQTF